MISLLFLHVLLLPELLTRVPFCLGVSTLGQGGHPRRRPSPVDANEDLIVPVWRGWIPALGVGTSLHPARLGEEVPADSWGLDCPPHPRESTPLPAQALLELGLPQFVLDPS